MELYMSCYNWLVIRRHLYFKYVLNIGYLDINMHSKNASLLLPHQLWHLRLKASKCSVLVVYMKIWVKLFLSKHWSHAEAAAPFGLALQSNETAACHCGLTGGLNWLYCQSCIFLSCPWPNELSMHIKLGHSISLGLYSLKKYDYSGVYSLFLSQLQHNERLKLHQPLRDWGWWLTQDKDRKLSGNTEQLSCADKET